MGSLERDVERVDGGAGVRNEVASSAVRPKTNSGS